MRTTTAAILAGLGMIAPSATPTSDARGAGIAPRSVSILPLGDSITYGLSAPASVPGGYRTELAADLRAQGVDARFLGGSTENLDPSTPGDHHEGHPGYVIDGSSMPGSASQGPAPGLLENLSRWLGPGTASPDVVLLMIGTNNMNYGYRVGEAAPDLGRLIEKIESLKPDARVILSTIPVSSTGDPALAARDVAFNRSLEGPEGLVAQLRQAGARVTLFDAGGRLTAGDLADGVHPTRAGYDKLGDLWAEAVTSALGVIPRADPAPTSTPEPSPLAPLVAGSALGAALLRRRGRPASALADSRSR